MPVGQQLVAEGKWPVIGEKLTELQSGHAADWTLSLQGQVETEQQWMLAGLRELPQTTITTDIHCVTRWSKYDMTFGGVLLRDLLAEASLKPAANFVSFLARSANDHETSLKLAEAIELGAMLVLDFDGRPLPLEHGGPLRMMVPGKYFYKSVKWLQRIDLLAEDRLGTWEADSGYHNNADPWQEQRYMAATINKQTAAKLIESRDFTGCDLRSIDASQRDLTGLVARQAQLRDANFKDCLLAGAVFDGANLSNAHFQKANLQGASFVGTDVEGADFCQADLRGANFENASLFGASFVIDGQPETGATFDQTTTFPDNALQVLTPPQADFVRQYV